MTTSYRFYSFVPGLYISPLQCGLQTAHAVSEMYSRHVNCVGERSKNHRIFEAWAEDDKTIIICNALNCAGVLNAWNYFHDFALDLELPTVIFYEDMDSLNNAPTATAIIVPDYLYDAFHEKMDVDEAYFFEKDGELLRYDPNSTEFAFISFLKNYRLV